MGSMDDELARVQASHHRLLATLDALTDGLARRDSLLPGWTVGHVLTHIARQADSVVRRLDGASRDEIVDQYAGGSAGRAAEIEAGAGRPAAALVDDVRATAGAVEAVAASVPDQAWERLTRSVDGGLIPARSVFLSRTREVEVHHVDLGLGYTPRNWPDDFVRAELESGLASLSGRTHPADLLAWLTGRGPAPELGPWR
jgi:maleylpyruvate isomerase